MTLPNIDLTYVRILTQYHAIQCRL